MEFSPNNPIVKRCLQGMLMEEKANATAAAELFMQAWNEATNDHEKFLAAYHISRQQSTITGELQWLETALQLAHNINDESVKAALPFLYAKTAAGYEKSGDLLQMKKYGKLADTYNHNPSDKGPFYHGTRAVLQVGDLLTPGFHSNYVPGLSMNHTYFTALLNGAALAAALAKGEGRERVYIVEPAGSFENDPNVTNKKFPGNPTRSYRTQEPLKIVGELKDWAKTTASELQNWREKLANYKGDIIN